MNAFDFMDAFGGIAPEKVQAALESMGYIPARKRRGARRTLRTVLLAAAMALLLTACGYAVGRFVNSPEQAWSVARQEVGRMKDMGILAPEVTLPEETYRVLELPEETTNDYWYGRIFKHRYNISAHGEKYFFNLDVDTATGKITKLTIEARPDVDDVPYATPPMPDTSDAPLDYEWGENYAYFDNYDDIIPGGITVDRFCTLLAEYWGFSGYTLGGTEDSFYGYDTEAPSSDMPLIDVADMPYLTVFFDGDQSGAPMYIDMSNYCFGNGVYFTVGTNHQVG